MRPLRVGKFAEDDRGNTFLILKIEGGVAKVESVVTKTVYRDVPVEELSRCTMVEETL